MRVMLGGCTCSTAASSPSVIGPRWSMVASAASRDAVRSSPALVAARLIRRDSRATASRSREASCGAPGSASALEGALVAGGAGAAGAPRVAMAESLPRLIS